jgi:DNA-binding LytR/AlgR family response regulator
MRILIVEDEPAIARRLDQFCRAILGDRLEVAMIAPTYEAAGAQIGGQQFDVMLLDLKLHDRDGMELLASSVCESFHTIVVSANTDQALRAFEFGVVDFVAKPFTLERIANALGRVQPGGRAAQSARCLGIRKHGRVELIAVDDVLYVEGADKYSEVVLANGRRELHGKTLSGLEAVLPTSFVRIHKSFLVRMSAVARIYSLEGGRHEAELKSGQRLPVGRSRFKEIKARLL